MTEYTTSSEAVREYLTTRERTAHWVHSHSPTSGTGAFFSPSVPPSELDDSDAPSYGPSDSDDESSHSLPPRMVLRWNDGRPDVPIAPNKTRYLLPQAQSTSRSGRGGSRDSSEGSIARPSTVHPQSRHGYQDVRPRAVTLMPSQRSRHAQTLSYASGAPPQGAHITPPASPEHIVILPSPQEQDVPNQVGAVPSQRSLAPLEIPGHSRSPVVAGTRPSHSATSINSRPIRAENSGTLSPSLRHAVGAPSQNSRHTTQPVENVGSRFHEPRTRATSQLSYAYSPPAIVYAPSHKHPDSRYAPPAIVYSPPLHPHHSTPRPPAPGITYSHSAPLPHPHNTPGYPHGGPYPDARAIPSHLVEDKPSRSRSRGHARSHSEVPGRSQSRHRREDSRGRSPAHHLSGARSPSGSRTPSSEEERSGASGSTYYVLPMPGQKVQIIQPNPPSVFTATSATKASQSPYSPASSQKKPFFQRIFSIPKFASSVDSRGSSGSTTRKLQRRHTMNVRQRRASET